MNLLCWEGYEADNILGEFTRKLKITTRAQTLLSDTATAHSLLRAELNRWDVLNINNPWVADFLCPKHKIKTLGEERFAGTLENLLPEFDRLSQWARDKQGNLVGICQRFGAFNLVVNTDRIDQRTAEDQGFNLARDQNLRFGILSYDDFNIFHICLGANLNPFDPLDNKALDAFSHTATDWFTRATLVTDDHISLNRALAAGDIDFYISGGVYTVSEARYAGYTKLRAITPTRGCIDGLGGIVFAEITSALQHSQSSPHALDFLEYIVQPEIAVRIATTANTLNPVAQMGDPAVFARFTKKHLDAIQWDTLSADVERCAMYQIPPCHQSLQRRLIAARNGVER